MIKKSCVKNKCLAMKEKGFAKRGRLSHQEDQRFCQAIKI
jgi:hypothetical protein